MFKILFAHDGSSAAAEALRFLDSLSLPPGSAVQLLYVVADATPVVAPFGDGLLPPVAVLEELVVREREHAERIMDEAVQRLSPLGITATRHIRSGSVAHEILAEADAFEADLILVGSRGLTGIDRFLLGSVARNVAKHSRRPVLVAHAPHAPAGGTRTVLVAYDGSEHARHAVAFTARMPFPPDTRFKVVHVVKPYAPFPGLFPTDLDEFHHMVREVRRRQEETAQHLMADAAEPLQAAGYRVETEMRVGDPAEEVLGAAEDAGAELIVAGARGASLIEGLVVGSVADRVLSTSARSVLIVH